MVDVVDLKSIFFNAGSSPAEDNFLKKGVAERSKVIDCKSIELFYMGSNPILLRIFINSKRFRLY
jgi:hypothetical protein